MMGEIDPFILALTSDEPVLEWFGMAIIEACRGGATVTLTVAPHHVNGNRMTHGGVVFAVADQAFAMAANTVLHFAATADASIQYLAPTRAGDALTARARTTYHDERRAVIDVEVTVGDRVVAVYRGTARATRRA
ncbi:PaaI family thioesterase [Microbacterium sp. C7(2022)]|uniref:PaaI family thioesterase n=1 Tax=Microbacterium sp. C7(2022) TaxID=2992759 RepID=UPI00237BCEF5|nr:hotdog fold thioesterase [Microbacterium sp. C7(2022)]MDE0545974.1 hotdog fold thioesterase [Microbacterium sp. C7(2022)]